MPASTESSNCCEFVVPVSNCPGQWEFRFLKAATTTTWSGGACRLISPGDRSCAGVDARGGHKGQAGWTGRHWCNKPGDVLASAHHQRHRHLPTPSPAHPLVSGMLQRGCRHTIFPTPPPGTLRSSHRPPPPQICGENKADAIRELRRSRHSCFCAAGDLLLRMLFILCWR